MAELKEDVTYEILKKVSAAAQRALNFLLRFIKRNR